MNRALRFMDNIWHLVIFWAIEKRTQLWGTTYIIYKLYSSNSWQHGYHKGGMGALLIIHPYWFALPNHKNNTKSNHIIPSHQLALISPTFFPAKVSLIYSALLQMGWSSRPLGIGLPQLLLHECWHSPACTVETIGKWGISLSSNG